MNWTVDNVSEKIIRLTKKPYCIIEDRILLTQTVSETDAQALIGRLMSKTLKRRLTQSQLAECLSLGSPQSSGQPIISLFLNNSGFLASQKVCDAILAYYQDVQKGEKQRLSHFVRDDALFLNEEYWSISGLWNGIRAMTLSFSETDGESSDEDRFDKKHA
jgi:hypothetical protein